MVGCQHCPEMACEPCQLNYDQAMYQNMRQVERARALGATKFVPAGLSAEVIRGDPRARDYEPAGVEGAVTAPWNVRVVPMWYSDARKCTGLTADYFATQVRVKCQWVDAGTSETHLGAWLRGFFS